MSVPGTAITGAGGASRGYQQISAATLAAATSLTVPARATIAYVSVDVGTVRWRDDGVDPTAAIGMQILAGVAVTFGNLTSLKFILSSGSPVLNVAYY